MHRKEGGNAVIFILIAIVLFGALAYTFMRGAQTGQGNLTAGQAKLIAQNIIGTSNTYKNAINKLIVRGCSAGDLSFENAPSRTGAWWNNPASPADLSCHFYKSEGANITDEEMETGSGTAPWMFSISPGMTSATDSWAGVLAILDGVSDQVCTEINRRLNNGWELIPSNNTYVNLCLTTNFPQCQLNPGRPWLTCTDFTHTGPAPGYYCPAKAGCYKYNGVNRYYDYIYTDCYNNC